jgi:ligand-binding sensor domain-containing protein
VHAFTLAMGIAAFAPAAALAALPPTPMFETIGVEAGLPSSEVYDLAEDRDGHLFIGTADGLARWDGVEFVVWRHDPDDPGSLPANNVQVVHVDREDRVWAGTEGGGLAMLGAERTRFRRWRDAGDGPGFSGNDVWSVAQSSDGAIWAGTFGECGRAGAV